MMTKATKISRRGALIMTGAGLAVASCTENSKNKDTTVSITGLWPTVGDNPNSNGSDAAIYPSFKPEYVTLVRVTSGKNWEISASHASFKLGTTTDTQRMDFAIDTFARFKRGIGTLPKINEFRDLERDPGSKIRRRIGNDGHGNSHNQQLEAFDFDDFRFGFQHEIFIWFDGAEVEFHKDAGGNEHFIAIGPLLSTGESGTINRSFFARRGRNTSSGNNVIDGPVMAIRNYHLNGFGQPIVSGKEVPFAISIYFTVPSKNGRRMLLLLDPDTGNGVGYDP